MNLARFNLIIGTALGFFLSSFLYLCVDDLKSVFVSIPTIAFLFAVYTYINNVFYSKKKDTFEYIEKYYFGQMMPLANQINDRMKYFDYFFELSVEDRLSHKNDVQKLHSILADLTYKIEHNFFNKKVLKKYYNKNFKETLFNMLLHFDITFLNRPSEIKSLYKFFFDDFDDFSKKAKEQYEYFIKYYQKNIVDIVPIEIGEEKKTLNEWVRTTNLSSQDCSNRELLLQQLQTLKELYSNQPTFYLALGNLYFICFSDFERSRLFLEKAILLDKMCAEAYVSLMGCVYRKTKKIELALKVLDKTPASIINNDTVLHSKVKLYLSEKLYDQCNEIAMQIKNINIKNETLALIERYSRK